MDLNERSEDQTSASTPTKETMASCRFCGAVALVRNSHIVPAFVWDWLRETSVSGMRGSETPNRRIQGGLKIPLLCEACEQRFSAWEREFAKSIFRPMHAPTIRPVRFPYDGTYVLKFCVSVSWRVIEAFRDKGLSHLTAEQKEACEAVATAWKDFLDGRTQHPGAFEQHVIPLDVIESSTGGTLSPFINRYLARAIDISMPAARDHVLTYAKMGRLLLLGFAIPPSHPHEWQGTNVHVRRGPIGDYDMRAPGQLADWMNERANYVASLLRGLSPGQQAKIASVIEQRHDEIMTSEAFRAMAYDVEHSGSAAFGSTKPISND
jgi:hypothetical protein